MSDLLRFCHHQVYELISKGKINRKCPLDETSSCYSNKAASQTDWCPPRVKITSLIWHLRCHTSLGADFLIYSLVLHLWCWWGELVWARTEYRLGRREPSLYTRPASLFSPVVTRPPDTHHHVTQDRRHRIRHAWWVCATKRKTNREQKSVEGPKSTEEKVLIDVPFLSLINSHTKSRLFAMLRVYFPCTNEMYFNKLDSH